MGKEEYLDNITIDGLDESYGTNMDVEDFENASATVVEFRIDGSASMDPYKRAMSECLEHYKEAIVNSKQADEIILGKSIFETKIKNYGYVSPEDFNTDYTADGWSTRLYDAIVNGRQSLLDYMNLLKNNGTNVRGCMVILSDGADNDSQCRANDARKAIEDLTSKEIPVAFIAFGQDAFGIADSIGIKKNNVKEVSNNESELRRIIALVSKSAISASKNASSGAGGNDDGGFFDV